MIINPYKLQDTDINEFKMTLDVVRNEDVLAVITIEVQGEAKTIEATGETFERAIEKALDEYEKISEEKE